MSGYVQVVKKTFTKNERELYFDGIGLGSWLNMEHFMMGIPGTDQQIRQTVKGVFGEETSEKFFDSFVYHFIAEDDFRYMKNQGINLVRVPFSYRLFIDDNDITKDCNKGFEYLDYLLSLASKYEIYVLLDLHTVPGGQNPDWHSDNGTGYTLFWEYELFRNQVISLWADIAERYSREEFLLGYDVLNEPFIVPQLFEHVTNDDEMATGLYIEGVGEKLNSFYKKVIASIRKVDKNHIIFLEGDYFASDFHCIHDIEDKQLAMTFHFYPTVWYPDLYEDTYSRDERKRKFEEVLVKLMDNAKELGYPILCGEAGYEIASNGFDKTKTMIEDTIELFHKYKVPYTLWSYKDAAFMGLVYPKSESPWMKFTDRIKEKWNHHMELVRAQSIVDDLCTAYFPESTKQDRYILSFRQRALLYTLEEEYVLKPILREYSEEELLKLPESFDWDNSLRYEIMIKNKSL